MKGYMKRGRVDGTWYLRVDYAKNAKRRRNARRFGGRDARPMRDSESYCALRRTAVSTLRAWRS